MVFSDSMQVTESYNEPSSKLSQELLTQELQAFDYTSLTSEVQIFVQSKTSEIKRLMRRSAQDIIDIGQKLIEVKEQLGHGNFRVWLLVEFDWSVRTAARFMQVATQFKCANLAHLNIAASALYLLAEPSTPKKTRTKALKLAEEGENITYTKAKAIINTYQEQTQPHALKPATTIDISAKATEDNSLILSQPSQSPQTHSQLEVQDEANSAVIKLSVGTVTTIESGKRLEQKSVEKIDCVLRENSEVANELQLELKNPIRVVNIENQNPELVTNMTQTFDLTFAGVRVDFEGDPKALIMLFKQMQQNPVFTKEILQYAKLLTTGS
ncbi:MAG: DUF3102 domain-containing protein [Rhizonema sp. PD38]|nr:DUF3102 domain-containing protein [Rhizonema sp. PD37]MDF5731217.1 DUF3102 domain-containing protein [Rhizonema sp. PD38]